MSKILALMAALGCLFCASFALAADASAITRPIPALAMGSKPDGKMCGGIAAIQCSGAKDYCHYDEGACRTIADAAGVCKPKPEMCTMIYAPVCGCDSKTYSSSCTAAAAGVSVAAKGECKAP